MRPRHTAPAIPPEQLDREFREQAFALGADLVGVAPVERFARGFDDAGLSGYAPTGFAPEELLPGARSVAVFAVRQLTGVVESAVADAESTYAFGNFGYVHLNRLMNDMTYRLARWVEERGWPALPLGSALASRRSTAAPDGDLCAPLYGVFSVKRAAVLTGLGRRARNGLVATPQFGVKVRLGVLLTEAPLLADQPLDGSPCPPGCTICIDACPTTAITPEGRVDHARCYSDCGRRGRTLAEARRIMEQQYTSDDPDADYLPGDHSGIDSFGNRRCRVACMAFCPLGEPPTPHLVRLQKAWLKDHPRVLL